MKNKFEALKAFQSWPREWQELCAEYWAESGASVPVALQEPSKPALPAIGDPFPFDGPKIGFGCIDQGEMKLEATLEPRGRTEYTLREIDFLESLIHGGFKATAAIKRFCERFGDLHPHASINTQYYKRRRVLIERGEFK